MKYICSKLYWPVFIVLFAFPVFALIHSRVDNLSFYLLFIVGLAALSCGGSEARAGFAKVLRQYWPLHLAMAGMFLAIFINQVALQNFVAKSYEYPSRMALFFLLLWVVLLVPYRLLRHMQWAYVAGAVLAAVKMYMLTAGGTSRVHDDFMPIIEFAQMALILGLFAIFSLRYEHGKLGGAGLVLKLVAGGAGLYAAYLSQTRGVWLTIPLLMLVLIFVMARGANLAKQFSIFLALMVLLGTIFSGTKLVQERVGQAKQDLVLYGNKQNLDTSLGVRLQLYQGSWLLFTEHPLLGVGRENFSNALGELERRGLLTEVARVQPHSHNELLYNMATLGLLGLAAILALYFVPAFYFWRELRHPDREVRATAGMGMALSVGFFALGLSDVMFMWGICDNFYAIIAATLYGYIIRRKQALAPGIGVLERRRTIL